MSGHPSDDLEPPTMSRDLARSRALSKKKRSEVADGTAASNRSQRIQDQLGAFNDGILNREPIDFMGSPTLSPSDLQDVRKLLDIIAKTRGMVGNRSSLRRLDDCTTD